MTISDNITAVVNTPISVDCVTSGIPTPTVTWTKDGEVLRNGHMVYTNGTLVIERAGVNDTGLYTCTAKNIVGEDSASSSIHVIGECTSGLSMCRWDSCVFSHEALRA